MGPLMTGRFEVPLSYTEAVAKAEEWLRKSGHNTSKLMVRSVERGIDLWFVRFDEGPHGSPEYSLMVSMETGEAFLQEPKPWEKK